jgi:hypothetical protein
MPPADDAQLIVALTAGCVQLLDKEAAEVYGPPEQARH